MRCVDTILLAADRSRGRRAVGMLVAYYVARTEFAGRDRSTSSSTCR